VILWERPTDRRLVEVAGDPPLAGAALVDEGLGAYQGERTKFALVGCRESEFHETHGAGAGQGHRHRGGGLRQRQDQQAREDGERVIARAERPIRRRPQAASYRVVRRLAPGRADGFRRVAGVAKVGGECTTQHGIGEEEHASIQSRQPPRRSRSGGSETGTIESHSIVRSGHAQERNQKHDRDPPA
jgi:hypothetical protein